ncbi:MAG: hypothetical protein MI920_02485 [Kiloniellales bacterium]|nr:hypothetical protein [Kiloniellales bacterium]
MLVASLGAGALSLAREYATYLMQVGELDASRDWHLVTDEIQSMLLLAEGDPR